VVDRGGGASSHVHKSYLLYVVARENREIYDRKRSFVSTGKHSIKGKECYRQ